MARAMSSGRSAHLRTGAGAADGESSISPDPNSFRGSDCIGAGINCTEALSLTFLSFSDAFVRRSQLPMAWDYSHPPIHARAESASVCAGLLSPKEKPIKKWARLMLGSDFLYIFR